MVLRLLATILLFSTAIAQSIGASNHTGSWPVPPSDRKWLLLGRTVATVHVEVIPLTSSSEHFVENTARRAFLASTTESNGITPSSFAFISCDDTEGNLHAPDVLNMVIDQNAEAAILYSRFSSFCNYTQDSNARSIQTDFPVFSTVSTRNSSAILTLFGQSMSMMPLQTILVTNAKLQDKIHEAEEARNGGADGPDSSPSTAVAMMILYSITGLITALFLVIIITGALRAHRHPERYGTRDVLGRPVQSRARGIARAMLDTIPIVKFGERNGPTKPGPTDDVELGGRSSETNESTSGNNEGGTVESTTSSPNNNDHNVESPSTPPPVASGAAPVDQEAVKDADADPTSHPTDGPSSSRQQPGSTGESNSVNDNDENLGCSICTDDFEQGQDIRVLPCDHMFHPACIDPWLLNVSGTCPLCRIELRSRFNNDEGAPSDGATNEERTDHIAPLETANPNRSSHRFSTAFRDALHLRRVRDAPPEERIAALRELRQSTDQHREREQSNNDSARAEDSQVSDADAERRRSRLAGRLHEAFRVRTRRGGES